MDRPEREQLVMERFRELSYRLRRSALRRLDDLELTLPLAMALHHLEEPMPMGALAQRLSCDASYVTGLADRLEERGLAERTSSTEDRRVKELRLTEEGRRIRNQAKARLHDAGRLLDGIADDELDALAAMLDRMATNLDAIASAAPEGDAPGR